MEYAEHGLENTCTAVDGPLEQRRFLHRMVVAEMFFQLVEQLQGLASAELASELDARFASNAAECCERCKVKLAELQLAEPNTFRVRTHIRGLPKPCVGALRCA
eukprot:COSAG01_NODE_6166_length_3814_cov_46.365276_8_plen_104_part_00